MPVNAQKAGQKLHHLSLNSQVLNEVCIYGKPCRTKVGRDSAGGIATPYGLDSPGIDSRWWRDFLLP